MYNKPSSIISTTHWVRMKELRNTNDTSISISLAGDNDDDVKSISHCYCYSSCLLLVLVLLLVFVYHWWVSDKIKRPMWTKCTHSFIYSYSHIRTLQQKDLFFCSFVLCVAAVFLSLPVNPLISLTMDEYLCLFVYEMGVRFYIHICSKELYISKDFSSSLREHNTAQ